MKILHVVLSLEVGGLENGLVNLVNHSRRFEHVICCLKKSGPMSGRLTRPIRVMEMGWERGKSLTLPFRLAALFRRERCDVVRCLNVTPLFYGFLGAKLAGIPVVVYSNGGRVFPEQPRRLRIERFMANRTDRVITVADELRDYMSEWVEIRRNRITTIENGVDLSRFTGPFPEGRKRLGLSGEDFVVGTVGRITPEKDHGTLLRAFRAFVSRINHAILLIVGDGPDRLSMEQLAGDLGLSGCVRFLGTRHDVPEILSAMDAFVLSSRWEGFSNGILEAMASGLPVVATTVGDTPKLVLPGATGFLVPAGDVPALTASMIWLHENSALRKSMGENGRRRVAEQFTLSQMVLRYETLFEELIASALARVGGRQSS